MVMADVRRDLSSNFAPLAHLTFPQKRSVIGVLSCPQCIQLKQITFDQSSQQYNERSLATFMLDTKEQGVKCIPAMFNVARYVVSVAGPLAGFHLVPNVSKETGNAHRVISERQGLRKILAEGHRNEELLRHLYAGALANVEWSAVVGPDEVLITHVGHRLYLALLRGQIAADKAIADVRAGVTQMHERGVAHTDLKMDNVFVDAGGAFLGDLEYVADVDTVVDEPYRAGPEGAGGAAARDPVVSAACGH